MPRQKLTNSTKGLRGANQITKIMYKLVKNRTTTQVLKGGRKLEIQPLTKFSIRINNKVVAYVPDFQDLDVSKDLVKVLNASLV